MSRKTKSKLLFCMLNNKVSGGNRILLELANRSLRTGFDVELLFLNGSGAPEWFDNQCTIATQSLADLEKDEKYDLIFASNASMVPTLLRYLDIQKLVLVCQGFESYCYGETITELFTPKISIENILKFEIPIISTSLSIQRLLQERIGRASYLVPVAIDRSQFPPIGERERKIGRPVLNIGESNSIIANTDLSIVRPKSLSKRVLAVGDFKSRFKGIFDLADALEILSKEISVELILLTQQRGGKEAFENFSFPVEFHCHTPQADLAKIYASCHVYCCASWYEGFGLPCLEAFSVGIPVVATKNMGVQEFAKDGENILLARPHSPDDLAAKLRAVLNDEELQEQLIKSGTSTVDQYNWQTSMSSFIAAVREIQNSKSPGQQPSEANLKSWLKDLETDGFYTPVEVEHELMWISGELHALCNSIKAGTIDEVESRKTLTAIRQHLVRHLKNPAASYYKEFKARYDLCQLLTVIEDPQDWQKVLKFN